jgi:hypothetical protein
MMNNSPTQPEPKRIIDLLARQRDLYQKLRELSERQRTMISGDRPDLLLNILRERQGLVTSLAQLNEEMGPYRRNWDTSYNALPDNYRQQASGLLQEINGLLRVILQTDREDTALLSARKQAVAGDIAEISGGQVANAAYAKQATGAGGAKSADVTG